MGGVGDEQHRVAASLLGHVRKVHSSAGAAGLTRQEPLGEQEVVVPISTERAARRGGELQGCWWGFRVAAAGATLAGMLLHNFRTTLKLHTCYLYDMISCAWAGSRCSRTGTVHVRSRIRW
jgi:hypothetical protein